MLGCKPCPCLVVVTLQKRAHQRFILIPVPLFQRKDCLAKWFRCHRLVLEAMERGVAHAPRLIKMEIQRSHIDLTTLLAINPCRAQMASWVLAVTS
ncbi:hypothethical protein (plasmid) [Ralstonia solanacearum PSI07]|nr:hypothethical protein [Ralstonia solanacearum PSI07]